MVAVPLPATTARSGVYPKSLAARVGQLLAGLALYGVSISLLVQARLGLDPWDVFHQGLARRTGLQIGWIIVIVGALVLLAWVPLQQRPGLGTTANVLLVGIVANLVLGFVPAPGSLPARVICLVAGVVTNGVATGLDIGAELGPGPRDGLMTGLAQRGLSIRRVRTMIEVGVLVCGFLLGGDVGFGTLLYALSIGPLAGFFIPLFTGRPTLHGEHVP